MHKHDPLTAKTIQIPYITLVAAGVQVFADLFRVLRGGGGKTRTYQRRKNGVETHFKMQAGRGRRLRSGGLYQITIYGVL